MHVNGRPVAAFDPEGLIFAAGVDSEMIKLYDLRSFEKVNDGLHFFVLQVFVDILCILLLFS